MRKQVTSSTFWIIIVLHAVVLVLVAMNFRSLLQNANIIVNNAPDLDLALKPILRFPDVWQNLTYIAGYFKIILALIVITSVSNEFAYGTARQNVIDGLSRLDWLLSKIGLAKVLALFSTLIVVGIGLSLGLSGGEQVPFVDILERMDYVLAYFIELVVYFIYALFLALLLKRTGISIILLLVYDIILEPVFSWFVPGKLSNFLPMNTLDHLNTFPFAKYIGEPTYTIVGWEQMAIAVGYGLAFGLFAYLVLKVKDL